MEHRDAELALTPHELLVVAGDACGSCAPSSHASASARNASSGGIDSVIGASRAGAGAAPCGRLTTARPFARSPAVPVGLRATSPNCTSPWAATSQLLMRNYRRFLLRISRRGWLTRRAPRAAMIIMINCSWGCDEKGEQRARSVGRRPCARGGELRVRPGVGRHPRRLGGRGAQDRAPVVGRPGAPGRGLGRPGARSTASPTSSRSATAASGRIGLDINTDEGRGDPHVARRHRRRVPHQPAAGGPHQARHRARRRARPQPADRLRAGYGAGPARSARRQGRVRRHHVLGSLGSRHRRHAARPGVPVTDARARLR